MVIILFIFLFFNNGNAIIKPDCLRWYALYGCENKMVLLKNIFRSDSSSFLSTFLLTHNPEKKIATLLDFSIPNYIKEDLKEKIIGSELIKLNEIQENSNEIKSSNILFLSKYFDDISMIYPPFFMSLSTYNSYSLSVGVFDSIMDHGKKIKVSTKGKKFNLQFDVFDNKYDVSNNWYNSFYSSKYDGLLNIGRYSGIWTKFNYMFIDKTEILFSENDINNLIFFNEKKINIKCASTYEIVKKRLIENNFYFNNYTIFEKDILDSKCIALNSVALSESHLGLHNDQDNFYNIVINPNSKVNYLPSKLYFILYEKNTELSSLLPKKIKKKDSKNNFISLKLINSDADDLLFYSKGIFDFSLDVNNEYDIVLGADMFKYFSKIKYSKKSNEYDFWIESITSDDNILLMSISFIVILDTFLLVRWYLTSHLAITHYVLFHILTESKTFYYNNSQAFSEIFGVIFGLVTLIISIISMCYKNNLPVYLFIVFGFLCFVLLLSISVSIIFIFKSTDKITNVFSRKKLQKIGKTKEGALNRWEKFSHNFQFLSHDFIVPNFIAKIHNKKNDEIIIDQSNRIKKIQFLIDKAVMKLFSISTTTVINQNIMIAIARQISHMSVLVFTMLVGLTTGIEERLVKAMLTLISILMVFQLTYYILLLILAFIKLHRNLNKSIWLTFIIVSTILLFLLTPFFCYVFAFNFLDSMNSNHSTFVIALTAIVLVCLTLILPPYLVLNETEKWSQVINNEVDIKIGDETGKD